MKIWINGCFDVLHYGHFKLISYAKSFNGTLKVGIDSDKRIKENKGKNRPFHSQNERIFNLYQINGIDEVCVFNSDMELASSIKEFSPDIFVIGDEYKGKPIIGMEYAKKIEYFSKIVGFSTTNLLYE